MEGFCGDGIMKGSKFLDQLNDYEFKNSMLHGVNWLVIMITAGLKTTELGKYLELRGMKLIMEYSTRVGS